MSKLTKVLYQYPNIDLWGFTIYEDPIDHIKFKEIEHYYPNKYNEIMKQLDGQTTLIDGCYACDLEKILGLIMEKENEN